MELFSEDFLRRRRKVNVHRKLTDEEIEHMDQFFKGSDRLAEYYATHPHDSIFGPEDYCEVV